ncbi:MAG: cytochrome P450 [Ilumatobacter sp.]|uniref:cytochrome P450 n=1 Tax=Ilumatobacter sp. TaxID=1967498 RepID=UPI00391D7773
MSDGAVIEPLDSLDDVDFFDPAVNECPYRAYRTLREQAPVWQDPRTRMWTLTRYHDVREAARDVETFSSQRPRGSSAQASADVILQLYRDRGWVPGRTLGGRDDPEHKQMRALFSHAFRPSRISALEPQIAEIADELMRDCLEASASTGRCDWVQMMAVPLPLLVIGIQMGADPDDIWRIKAWTDAWVQRLGMMQTPDEVVRSTEMEIEAQHYFQPIFERLRVEPNDTLLSDLVNTVIPAWGRTLTDEELHGEMMADTFVGGSETTTNAISQALKLLIEHPNQWALLRSDPERFLPVLAEEAVRLEGPVQTLFRWTTRDVEVAGTTIPAHSMVALRWGAANRDESAFERPDRFDLERTDHKQHVGFGFGTHFCLGAPLARREIIHAFRALLRHVDDVGFVDEANDFSIAPNYVLRALRELHVSFTPR